MTNKSRLKLLHRREEHLQDLFDSARSQLLTLAANEGQYVQFLEGIIVQGFLQLLEPSVYIQTRKKDVQAVEQAAAAAAKNYKEISGRDVAFEVSGALSDDGCVSLLSSDDVYVYPSHSAGGVKLISGTGRITIDNTLDERLRLLEDRVSSLILLYSEVTPPHLLTHRCFPKSDANSSETTRTVNSTRKSDNSLDFLLHTSDVL